MAFLMEETEIKVSVKSGFLFRVGLNVPASHVIDVLHIEVTGFEKYSQVLCFHVRNLTKF